MLLFSKSAVAVACFASLASLSFAEDLIIAPNEAPMYQLSNIRIGKGLTTLEVDYKLSRKGSIDAQGVRIAGKTKEGELSVTGASGLEESGVLRIGIQGRLLIEENFEIYLVLRGANRTQYLVSNVVRLGNPGPVTRARNLTEKELKAIEQAKIAHTPPAEIPEGFLAIDDRTKLVSGMPVKAGKNGDWVDAEVIGFKGESYVMLKMPGEDEHLRTILPQKWIAVDPEILAKAESDPGQFKPSVLTLFESALIIPDGSIPLGDDVELLPGTPLLYNSHNWSWTPVHVVSIEENRIEVRNADAGRRTHFQSRKNLVISGETLKRLGEPDIATKFAENLVDKKALEREAFSNRIKEENSRIMERVNRKFEENSRTTDKASQINHANYPIKIPVPKGAQLVSDDLIIEKGTSLAACWGRSWKHVTAIHENEDGSIYVHWNDYGDSFDCNMTRDQLIIEDKTIGELSKRSEKESGDEFNEEELRSTLRTWTDATGKHKVEARYVAMNETLVMLKSDDGREIKLPIEKLSDEDKAILTGIKPAQETNSAD